MRVTIHRGDLSEDTQTLWDEMYECECALAMAKYALRAAIQREIAANDETITLSWRSSESVIVAVVSPKEK
jgi:hypothetical protein